MLDLFFRKYAWMANLVLLFAAAWLLARTVNVVVGSAVRPRPQLDTAAVAAAPPQAVLPASLDSDRLHRLIGIEPPRPEEAAASAAGPTRPQTCQDPAARPVKSELRLQLVAGVVAEVARYSLATILDPSSRESRVLGVGEEFAGARLLGIERLTDALDPTGNAFRVVAVVCNGGTKEYLDADPGAGSPEAGLNLGVAPVPGRPGGRPGPPAPGVVPLEGIRKVSENRYDLDKQVIEGALNNLNTLATQARLVPSFKNGVANGFKLFQIQPGSLYSAIGIENGDVITRINGYEVNSPDKALEVYQKLRESAHVAIELERGGQIVKKDYNISGP
jgi:general secretion pathway protein C